MTCQHCGKATNYDFEFCPVCGKPAYTPEQPKPGKCIVTKAVLWIFLAINIVFFTMFVITRLMKTIDGDYHNEWWINVLVFAASFITAQALMLKYAPKIKNENRYHRLLCLPLLVVLGFFVVLLDTQFRSLRGDEISAYYIVQTLHPFLIPVGSLLFALGMVLTKTKRRSAVPAVLTVLATDLSFTFLAALMNVLEYGEFYTWDEAVPIVGVYLVVALLLIATVMLLFPAPAEKKKIP